MPTFIKDEYLYFNVNDYVEVQLTDEGRAFLKKQDEEFYKDYPAVRKYTPKREDENGWSQWQMHELMEELGSGTSVAKLRFATSIRIKKQNLKEEQ